MFTMAETETINETPVVNLILQSQEKYDRYINTDIKDNSLTFDDLVDIYNHKEIINIINNYDAPGINNSDKSNGNYYYRGTIKNTFLKNSFNSLLISYSYLINKRFLNSKQTHYTIYDYIRYMELFMHFLQSKEIIKKYEVIYNKSIKYNPKSREYENILIKCVIRYTNVFMDTCDFAKLTIM